QEIAAEKREGERDDRGQPERHERQGDPDRQTEALREALGRAAPADRKQDRREDCGQEILELPEDPDRSRRDRRYDGDDDRPIDEVLRPRVPGVEVEFHGAPRFARVSASTRKERGSPNGRRRRASAIQPKAVACSWLGANLPEIRASLGSWNPRTRS